MSDLPGVTNLVNAILMACVKVHPVMDGDFFVGESLGSSPVPWCQDCTRSLEKCRVCSSETAVCSDKELEEYSVLKENCTVEP